MSCDKRVIVPLNMLQHVISKSMLGVTDLYPRIRRLQRIGVMASRDWLAASLSSHNGLQTAKQLCAMRREGKVWLKQRDGRNLPLKRQGGSRWTWMEIPFCLQATPFNVVPAPRGCLSYNHMCLNIDLCTRLVVMCP